MGLPELLRSMNACDSAPIRGNSIWMELRRGVRYPVERGIRSIAETCGPRRSRGRAIPAESPPCEPPRQMWTSMRQGVQFELYRASSDCKTGIHSRGAGKRAQSEAPNGLVLPLNRRLSAISVRACHDSQGFQDLPRRDLRPFTSSDSRRGSPSFANPSSSRRGLELR